MRALVNTHTADPDRGPPCQDRKANTQTPGGTARWTVSHLGVAPGRPLFPPNPASLEQIFQPWGDEASLGFAPQGSGPPTDGDPCSAPSPQPWPDPWTPEGSCPGGPETWVGRCPGRSAGTSSQSPAWPARRPQHRGRGNRDPKMPSVCPKAARFWA